LTTDGIKGSTISAKLSRYGEDLGDISVSRAEAVNIVANVKYMTSNNFCI
jgi:hypothetical protein